MKTFFDINDIISQGQIENEFEHERAMVADRHLKSLSEESNYFKDMRMKLRNILIEYEKRKWSDIDDITDEQVAENDQAELLAEQELFFVEKRKKLIKQKLKTLNITQQDLAHILGHKSKTHMSELINGLCPFTLKDLVIINRLLEIKLADLIPTFLSREDRIKVQTAIQELNKPEIRFFGDKYLLPQ
jgi:transcriptional regulator with XRE-family HTH domain